jgi:hypothetical protein
MSQIIASKESTASADLSWIEECVLRSFKKDVVGDVDLIGSSKRCHEAAVRLNEWGLYTVIMTWHCWTTS